MAELADQIEVLENRYMRAWASGDMPTLRQLTGGGFQLVIGSKPAVMLDRASWLDAAPNRFVSSGFRFGGVYVREIGGMALFASQVELEARLDGHDWSGPTGYVQSLLDNVLPNLKSPVALICGSKEMIHQTRERLVKMGFKPNEILTNY